MINPPKSSGLRLLLRPLRQRKHPILAFALIGYIQQPALFDFSLAAVPDGSSIEAACRRLHRIANLSQSCRPSNLQQIFANDCRTVESVILAAFRPLLGQRLEGSAPISEPDPGPRNESSPSNSSRRCLSRRTVSVGVDLGPIVRSPRLRANRQYRRTPRKLFQVSFSGGETPREPKSATRTTEKKPLMN